MTRRSSGTLQDIPKEKPEELCRLWSTLAFIQHDWSHTSRSRRRGIRRGNRLWHRFVLLTRQLSDISIKYVRPSDHRSSVDQQRKHAVIVSGRVENNVLCDVRPIASGEVEGTAADREAVDRIAHGFDVRAQGVGLFVLGGVLQRDKHKSTRFVLGRRKEIADKSNGVRTR